MAVLTRQQAATTSVQLSQFKAQAEEYFKIAKAQVFAGLTFTANQAQIAAQASVAESDFRRYMGVLDTMIVSMTYQGHAATKADVADLLGKVNTSLKQYQAQVIAWNEASPLPVVFGVLTQMFDTAMTTLLEIQKGFGGAAQTFAKMLPYLPWIIVGAFLAPSVIRFFTKRKREGSVAAWEQAAGDIEGGRRAAGRAAGTVATTAVKAALI